MNKKILRTAILMTTLLSAIMIFGQNVPSGKPNFSGFLQDQKKIQIVNGSVYASFADRKVRANDIVSDLNKLLKLDENHTFEQISQREDELGFIHTNYQEYYKGYPVDGIIIMFHQKDGYLKSITGNVATLKNIVIRLEISDIEATNIARKNLGVTKVFRESPVQTVFTQNLKNKQYYLAKKVRIESFSPVVRYDVFVDANTGEVLKKLSLIYNTDVQGTAQTLLYNTQTITCDSLSPGSFRLYDNARRIGTYNGATWNPFGWDYIPSVSMLYTNTSSAWNNNPALDVHWGMEITHDYYQNTFGRNSYDNLGGTVFNIYNPVALDSYGYQNNAAWMGEGIMVYGRGGSGYHPFVSLDCAAHELTHGVTEYNGNGGLNYQGESGALNESFSDIFGTCVEFSALPNPNWTIGEDIVINGVLRDMSNPNSKHQPDTYLGNYWANTNSSTDNGGVHTNSGVQNFWFYLLCEGGTGTNDLGNSYSVTPIGMVKAQKITYRNLMNYIAPNASYVSSYNGSLLATADLYGNSSAEYTAVKQAWYAVGIDEDTTEPVVPGCGYGTITYLNEPSGTFDDGSGSENYSDNQLCLWVIEPNGASYVTLSFNAFDTETGYDFVKIYNSYENYYYDIPIASYSGHSIPNSVTSNTGMMIVLFNADEYVNYSGWTAQYTSDADPSAGGCAEETHLTEPSGTFDDGSNDKNYFNNQHCVWFIEPPDAISITLSFDNFETEANYDYVAVYDSYDNYYLNSPLAMYSGNSLPNPITSNTGIMIVVFKTDQSLNYSGWTANYSSILTSVENIEQHNISIFPNPANDVLNIQFNNNIQNVTIDIYDMIGKLIRTYPLQNIQSSSTQTLNIESIPAGIYNIRIIMDNEQINRKLFIAK
ncbi:MAG: M4 family metallopeptidase [Paludibacter sp.]|nr:M4 family metallopeptidase [Paludibacter sp.]